MCALAGLGRRAQTRRPRWTWKTRYRSPAQRILVGESAQFPTLRACTREKTMPEKKLRAAPRFRYLEHLLSHILIQLQTSLHLASQWTGRETKLQPKPRVDPVMVSDVTTEIQLVITPYLETPPGIPSLVVANSQWCHLPALNSCTWWVTAPNRFQRILMISHWISPLHSKANVLIEGWGQ